MKKAINNLGNFLASFPIEGNWNMEEEAVTFSPDFASYEEAIIKIVGGTDQVQISGYKYPQGKAQIKLAVQVGFNPNNGYWGMF